MSLIFSDLHLRDQSEDVCFRVLDWIGAKAADTGNHVVFCGDFLHIRYQVGVRLLNRVHTLLGRWGELGIEVDLVPGNHDQVDIAGSNALEVFSAHDHVRVWTDPGVLEQSDQQLVGFVPYRKDPEEQLRALLEVDAEGPAIIFSHFGRQGSLMNNGTADREGLAPVALGATLVLGHYHKHQAFPRGFYVGSPYQTSFGEVGNVCGCLILQLGRIEFCPIDVGAPRHHILVWDPAQTDQPPTPDQAQPQDKIRIDIKASQEMILAGKFKGVLARVGLEEAQVNVVPVRVDRSVKMDLTPEEPLASMAARFAAERFRRSGSDGELQVVDLAELTEALGRWSQ